MTSTTNHTLQELEKALTIRWVVEQAIAHLHQFKRLAVRWERCLDLLEGFPKRAASLIC
ncbi:hypothetical protein O1R50_16330 [Glycomyces luteolus]|uniref:Uncharacterized protein n=1 Tax=Glycomyces luteolus TaxID=2670330 RepID=A0A9X3PD03_9ACTN|nr:hypothetical protein [Glycomyces luteolus]MDA1361200.1 hypothetical protein [Glycomyces luteolus]